MTVPDYYQQRRVLRRLALSYPSFVEISTIPEIDNSIGQKTLFYLAEKGLIDQGYISERPGQPREMLKAKVSAKGLEMLREPSPSRVDEDGVIESWDLEAFRNFLKLKVERSGASDDKNAASRIMSMSERELKAALLRLITYAAEKPAMLIQAIEPRHG